MLPERLESLRKALNLSQRQLAKEIQVSQQNINFWETGKRNPKHESLEKLASFFDVSTDYLLGKSEIKNTSSTLELTELLNYDTLTYKGEPLSKTQLEKLQVFVDSL